MFARQAEHLIILSDSGLGHLNRVHSLLTSFPKRSNNQSTNQPPNQTVFQTINQSINQLPPDVDRFIRSLFNRKTWPEFPTDLPKLSGYQEFKKESKKIEELFFDYVHCLIDCLMWFDQTIKLLTDLSNTVHEININQSIDLSNYLFTLIERYTKLHCLIDCLNDPQVYIAAYFYAQYVNNQSISQSINQTITVPLTSLPDSYSKLAQFFTKYGNQSNNQTLKHSIKQLQSEHTMLSRMIGTTLSGYQSINQTIKLSDVKNLIDSKAFLLNPHETESNNQSNNQTLYTRIQSISRTRDYIIWSCLLCPDALLVSDSLIECLIDCLINDPIIMLHRDQTINQSVNLMHLFGDVFDNHPTKRKYKTTLKNLSINQSITQSNNVYAKHAEMRLYLNRIGDGLIDCLTDLPNLIPPKLNMLFAYLHIARDEVLWFARNQSINQAINQAINQSNKHAFPRSLTDDTYSMLMRNIDLIVRLIESNRSIIQPYYLSLIQTVDCQTIIQTINQAISVATIDPLIMQLMNHVVDTLDPQPNDESNALSIDQSFETIRLNWYRISSGLSMTSSMLSNIQSTNQAINKQSINQSVYQSFNQLIAHTRNIDCIDSQLKLHSSLHQLFWHKSEAEQMYETCLNDQSNNQSNSQSNYQLNNQLALMSYMKAMTSSVLNVHRIHLVEHSVIIGQSINQSDRMMKSMVKKLEEQMCIIERELGNLRLIHQSNNQASNQAIYQSSNQAINQAKNVVSSICQAIAELDDGSINQSISQSIDQSTNPSINPSNNQGFLIGNAFFSPREYLLDWAFSHLKTRIKTAFFPSNSQANNQSNNQSANLSMNLPSVALALWRDCLFAMQTVEKAINQSISDLVFNTLLHEFVCDDDVGVDSIDDRSTIHMIAQYYMQVINQSMQSSGEQFIFSPLHQSFHSLNPLNNQSPLSKQEFDSLAVVIGPSGVRILFARLVNMIAPKFASIKSILDDNMNNQSINQSINQLIKPSVNLASLNDAVNNSMHLNEFLNVSIFIGCVLSVRSLMLQSVYDLINQSVNQSLGPRFVGLTLLLASNAAHCHSRWHASLTVLDLLAADCGIPMGEADHLVRHLLGKTINQSTKQSSFSILPEMCGLSLSSSKWKNSSYSSQEGGHVGNHHCAAVAMKQMIVNWNRLMEQSNNQSNKQSNNQSIDVESKIASDFQRWLSCSSKVVFQQFQPSTNMLSVTSSKSLQSIKDLSMGREEIKRLISPSAARDVGGVSAQFAFFDSILAQSEGRLNYNQLERCLPFTLIRENLTQIEEKQDVHFNMEEVEG